MNGPAFSTGKDIMKILNNINTIISQALKLIHMQLDSSGHKKKALLHSGALQNNVLNILNHFNIYCI